jgi:predicted  nucleic acid-binding Zn-ribbon protein
MNSILQDLLRLQALDFGETREKDAEAQAETLRGKIPQPFIGHYERLRVRGKKGVALVRNQVCTGCHMRVPIGQITVLMRGEDIQLCESCGRYLHLAAPEETEPVVQAEAPKPKKKAPAKPRKRRTLAAVL